MQNICKIYAYICIKYAFDMQKYEFNMYKYAVNMHKICTKYAQNMPLHRLQHGKYAIYTSMQFICKKICSICNKNMQKICKNIQNMHKSMYLHIYALPALLMTA